MSLILGLLEFAFWLWLVVAAIVGFVGLLKFAAKH